MSLQVWLPLIENIKNQGLNPIQPTSDGLTLANNGKLGKSYLFNGNSYIAIPNVVLPSATPAWSFSCWFYLSSLSPTTAQCFFSERTGTNGLGYSIFIYANNSKMIVDDGARWTVTPMTFAATTWYHLTITRNAAGKKIYINGELKASTDAVGTTSAINNNGCLIGFAQTSTALTTGGQGFQGQLNDVRIYNHCLTEQEVKEIAKGLILHYPLTHRNMGQNNLFCIDKVTKQSTSNTTITKSNSTITLTCGKVNYGAFRSLPSGEYFSFETGTTYTVSGHIKVISKGSDNCNPRLCIRNSSNTIQAQATMTATEEDVSFSLTPSTTFNGYICGINTWSSGSNNTGTAQTEFSNIKLEIGAAKTAYTPNSTDALYTQMNLGNNIEYDTSGYNHNGTRIGSLIYDSNNPKYGISTYIADGLNNRVLTPVLNMPTDAITLNIWFKSSNTTPTGNYHMVIDSVGIGDNSDNGRQWYEMAVYKTGYFRGGLFVNGVRKADNCTSTTCLNGNWHMLTMTYDGTAVKCYFDGVLEKSTSAAITTGLSTPTALMIGRDGPTTSYACKEVYLSDLRIYATALSAEDILSLYHNNAYIDTSGNIYGAIRS